MVYEGSQARGSNWSYSCWPTQPQQRRILATSAIYTTAQGNAGSLPQWVRPEIKPTTSWLLVGFVSTVPQWELPKYILEKECIIAFEYFAGENIEHTPTLAIFFFFFFLEMRSKNRIKLKINFIIKNGCLSWSECNFQLCTSDSETIHHLHWLSKLFVYNSLTSYFLFTDEPAAYRSSQARGQIGAGAAGLHHSHSNTRSEPHLWPGDLSRIHDLHHSLQQSWILNLLRETRDWTSRYHVGFLTHWATTEKSQSLFLNAS